MHAFVWKKGNAKRKRTPLVSLDICLFVGFKIRRVLLLLGDDELIIVVRKKELAYQYVFGNMTFLKCKSKNPQIVGKTFHF